MKSFCASINKGCWFAISSVLCVFFLSKPLFAEWEIDKRLTCDENSSGLGIIYRTARNIAADGNDVHIVWTDDRNGNSEIYYKRSTNGGVNWGDDIRLTNDNSSSLSPSIAVSGSIIHIVWTDDRNGNSEIYYKRSTNGGVNWGDDIRLTNDVNYFITPYIAASGSNVHVIWSNYTSSSIHYQHSTDGGVTWETNIPISATTSFLPSLAVSGSDVHIVWYNIKTCGDWDVGIYHRCSSDGGITWDPSFTNLHLISEQDDVRQISMTASGSVVHVVWSHSHGVVYSRSYNGGYSWSNYDVYQSEQSWHPVVVSSGSVVHLLWEEHYNAHTPNIYCKRSTTEGQSWESDINLVTGEGMVLQPCATVSGTCIHITWTDQRDGNNEIYYKRNPIGNMFCDLDIYDNEEDLHQGFLDVDLTELPEVASDTILSLPLADFRERVDTYSVYPNQLFWPYTSNVIQIVGKFKIVNPNVIHNPDYWDGPGNEELLVNVRYRVVPYPYFKRHSTPLVSFDIPSTLSRGVPQTGIITLTLTKNDFLLESVVDIQEDPEIVPVILPNEHYFRFIVEAQGSQTGELVSDDFIIRLLFRDF